MSMTVVIGAASNAELGGGDRCIISANWNFEPGRQDAFCLGSFTPSSDHTIYKPQMTLSLTLYAPGPEYSTDASTNCEEPQGDISASVIPASCDTGVDGASGNWWVTSYNYSKGSKDQPAQESWSLTKWVDMPSGSTPTDRTINPTYIIRGITQGQSTDAAVTGITFIDTFAESKEGSVSAGGQGQASTTTHGIVSAVGGGSSAVSDLGNGSATIPYTPLYI